MRRGLAVVILAGVACGRTLTLGELNPGAGGSVDAAADAVALGEDALDGNIADAGGDADATAKAGCRNNGECTTDGRDCCCAIEAGPVCKAPTECQVLLTACIAVGP